MLDEILAVTRKQIDELELEELRLLAGEADPARSLTKSLTGTELAVIAEVKRRSPSRGDLAPQLDPVEQARLYAAGGAAAISVLTNEEFFGGFLSDLSEVRREVELPVLRKDFILDPAQIWESRAVGADAVLLIVAALSDNQLSNLLSEAADAGLEALVEVHNQTEISRALAAGAQLVGVNNRDLTTFTVDLAVADRLAPLLRERAVMIAESGISQPGHAAAMAAAGYDAILVGEALVLAPDPAALVASLREAAR